ncbi:MAG TPA: cupin domain-containing protein [Tenuifilaceae bacterium]|nr:cupin domain-containing protein [Tenuifilaceae bacterium]
MSNEFPKAQKFSFVNEVDYSVGGIVSKNVIKRKVGNISLFAFDKGESLSTHSAPFDATVQILEGTAHIVIADKPYDLKAGETIIMPAGIPHSVEAPERMKMLLTMIKE